MQFTINRNLFLENLNNAMRAISSRASIPILSGIKLSLSEQELTLTGSDTNISIQIEIPVNDDLHIQSTGAIVLPARFFSEIIKKLPGKDFSFEVKESFQTKITSENTEFMINGLDANNYPHLPEISTSSSFNVSGKTFRNIINETVFAVASQESRPTLNGVNFVFRNNSIKAVATDSHRLSQREIDLENGPQADATLIIPGTSLVELSRIIGETDPEIIVTPGDNQVLFNVGNLAFYTRLLEGSYPDTDRLIPTESMTKVEFDLSTLARSLERASLLTHESRNNVVKMSLDVDNQTVKLEGDSPEIGNVEEEVAFKSLQGDNLEISFNPDYLRDALRASITDTIVMNFTQPLRPFTVTPGREDVNFIQLITPVRTY
ncbi:DNA polymerase-3 subunit beta [Lactobacillus colini]|uniref:Beta sliding clamp n=1 Tax=Lactobacillus colini TaxID=1819254 RepID=A0ABS4MGS2_9LACO|nr:DNA polymerase III subunit beta [Lactobacillus colini]MBP2058900.1 DNA polymerase-3 subunit beta [Lactobacillus colini]